jgi:dTDP-4-amino-4,6-dideoxygalactose transaminase
MTLGHRRNAPSEDKTDHVLFGRDRKLSAGASAGKHPGMTVPLLDLTAQHRALAPEIEAAAIELIRSQRFILGAPVERLEGEIAARVGVRHAIGCASGTDALLLALKALQLEPGDEVIIPSFTFFATAGAVWNAGLTPVFCDIDPVTFNVTAATIEAKRTDRTRAIVPVHLFGQMAPMAGIMELAGRHGLAVIEDAAQSIDAAQTVEGEDRRAGSVGTMGAFSFFPSKNLGGWGDGGMITTDDDALAERLRKLRVHGGRQMYHHEMVGTNSRLDALQAVALSVKLPHLDGWTDARRAHARHYDRALAGIDAITTPAEMPGNRHVYNQYTIRARHRDELKQHLDAHGIGNGIYYPVPLHLQQCFESLGGKPGDLPVTEQAAREVLSLPVFPELTEAQLDAVVRAATTWHRSPSGA